MKRPLPILLATFILGACAGGPRFDARDTDRAVTPKAAVAEQAIAKGKTVIWGGVILNTVNLRDSTRLEVLAYPLDGNQKPKLAETPLGRFIVGYAGYLEPADYAEGRVVTVRGTIGGITQGRIGETDYTYPLLTSGQIYLWPRGSQQDNSNVHFGIGIGIGL